jgi:HAMP domain-containing protein
MRLDWLLSPLTIYSAAAVCLLTSLVLVVRSRVRRPEAGDEAPAPAEPPNTEIVALKTEVEQLRESVSRLEETLPVRGSGAGINVAKRAIALRMHRRGELVSNIAVALETPANEIALLVKLSAVSSQLSAGALEVR